VTRDNSWFNANNKLKETVAHAESLRGRLRPGAPIFVIGTEEQAKGI
jgi:hypothetical protein